MDHARRRLGLAFVAVALLGCTAVLGIDEDYYLAGQGGATSTTTATTNGSNSGGATAKANGEPCGDPAECESGSCTDGVCCADACEGPCVACSEAAGSTQNGVCAPHAPLTDPEMACGADQTCDGNGACFMCGARPTPPGTVCPAECTGGCMGGECRINCGAAGCQGAALVCPPDFACSVACNGDDACRDATVTCPDTFTCQVVCDSSRACENIVLACGSGVCEMACQGGPQVCSGAQMNCGPEACLATCNSPSQPTQSCGRACFCQDC